MKTIRGKLLSLFIAEITAIMLLVLLLFNLAVSVYFDRNAKAELKNTFSAMNVLIQTQLLDMPANDQPGDDALLGLSSALTASRLSGSESFFIFDEDFNLLFPDTAEEAGLSDQLLSQLGQINFAQENGQLHKLTGGGLFYAAGLPFDKLEGRRLTIVFLADMSDSLALVSNLNLILVAIMVLSMLSVFIFARAAARSISRPIQMAGVYAAEIGKGNFISVPADDSSVEIAQLNRSMNEMSDRLRAFEQAQQLFLQNASHELRTPLMSIQGYAEAIQAGIGYDPKEAAAVIRAESLRLNGLVGQLLTLSRMDNSLYGENAQSIALGEFISESIYRYEGLAVRENKQVVFSGMPEDALITADESLLRQALDNCVSNCLRYAKEKVSITLDRHNGEAVIRISDDGPGFDEDDLPHIFERFYKGRGGSYGLGLSIARKAVQLCGGDIRAYNGSGGAVFTVSFPVSQKKTD